MNKEQTTLNQPTAFDLHGWIAPLEQDTLDQDLFDQLEIEYLYEELKGI
jgi:hypothetical protein